MSRQKLTKLLSSIVTPWKKKKEEEVKLVKQIEVIPVKTDFQEDVWTYRTMEEGQGFYCWRKGSLKQFTENFSSYEFECNCDGKDCQEQKIELKLVAKLQWLRESLKMPLRVTSGYRCQKYQDRLTKKGLKTAKNSQHMLGRAVDIVPAGGKGVDYDKRKRRLLQSCEQIFQAVGIASNFLHVDLRDDKQRRWYY